MYKVNETSVGMVHKQLSLGHQQVREYGKRLEAGLAVIVTFYFLRKREKSVPTLEKMLLPVKSGYLISVKS